MKLNKLFRIFKDKQEQAGCLKEDNASKALWADTFNSLKAMEHLAHPNQEL